MKRTDKGVILLLLSGVVPVALRASTIITVICDNGAGYQQVSDAQSAACSLTGWPGVVDGSGSVSAGGLSVSTGAFSDYSYPYATANASWDVVFPTAEMLTWRMNWTYGGDYSLGLDMGGQYAPLYQWISENLFEQTWTQVLPAGDYTFSACSQDYGEGDASLSATLIAETPVGDPNPAPEPNTWILAAGALAGCGLLAARRFKGPAAPDRPGTIAPPLEQRRTSGGKHLLRLPSSFRFVSRVMLVVCGGVMWNSLRHRVWRSAVGTSGYK